MTISRLARAAGVGVETVRYYQRRGLMPVPRPTSDFAFRAYSEGDLQRLRFIRRAQAAGFTLEEIGELLALDKTAQRTQVRGLARARLAALDRQFAEMKAARAALNRLLSTCLKQDAGPCPILEAFGADTASTREPGLGARCDRDPGATA